MEARSGGALWKALGLSGTGSAGPSLEGVSLEGSAGGGGRGRGARSRTPGPTGAVRSSQSVLCSSRGEELSFGVSGELGFARIGDLPSETDRLREEER